MYIITIIMAWRSKETFSVIDSNYYWSNEIIPVVLYTVEPLYNGPNRGCPL